MKRTVDVTPVAATPPTISMYSTIFTSPHRPVFGRHSPKNVAESPPPVVAASPPPTLGAAAYFETLRADTVNFEEDNRDADTGFTKWCCRRFLEPTRAVMSPNDENLTNRHRR